MMVIHIMFIRNFKTFLETGQCYTFGSNQFGQLGWNAPSSNREVNKPEKLKHLLVKFVSCGDTFTMAVTQGISF